MSDIVAPLLQWLNAHPELAGLVTFIISAAESVAIIGTFVPGSIMMTALGTLAGAGVVPLWKTIIYAILGAIVGDGISYWLGHYFKSSLPQVWPFRRYPTLLKTGEVFFYKYGYMSVFIGRFVGPVRALVPLVAGMLGMRPLPFIVANVASAIGWAPAYMLPGILLGAASLELPPEIAMHVIIVLVLIALFVLLCLWFIYILLQLVKNQIDQLQNWIWSSLQHSTYFSPLTELLKHHDPQKKHGQLGPALFFMTTVILFLCLAGFVMHIGPERIMANEVVFHLFRGMRTPAVDVVMINLTLLGQKQVVLPFVIVFFAWLLINKRWWMAFHALALGTLAAGSVYFIKHIIHTPRPWGMALPPTTFSMPSGHATLATTVFMGLAFLVASALPQRHRKLIYMLGLLITLLVGISRLYLGAHWLTDVLSSWLLSAALLALVIISYQRQYVQPIGPMKVALVSFFALLVTFSTFHYLHFNALKMAYAPKDWPILTISMPDWWQRDNALAAYHARLFGFPSERINIEWAGSLDDIRNSLIKEGWTKPPARDWISTLHRITDISSTAYLPLISLRYLDKKPVLRMTRKINNGKDLLIIRLWDADRSFTETTAPLWVGTVNITPRSYNWLFKNKPPKIQISQGLVFPRHLSASKWQWKPMLITFNMQHNTREQTVLLIRPTQVGPIAR